MFFPEASLCTLFCKVGRYAEANGVRAQKVIQTYGDRIGNLTIDRSQRSLGGQAQYEKRMAEDKLVAGIAASQLHFWVLTEGSNAFCVNRDQLPGRVRRRALRGLALVA